MPSNTADMLNAPAIHITKGFIPLVVTNHAPHSEHFAEANTKNDSVAIRNFFAEAAKLRSHLWRGSAVEQSLPAFRPGAEIPRPVEDHGPFDAQVRVGSLPVTCSDLPSPRRIAHFTITVAVAVTSGKSSRFTCTW